MAVRVSGEGARRVLFDRRARVAVQCRRAAEIERASDAAQAGACGREALPTQAQVAAWVRPGVAQRKRAEQFWLLGRMNSTK